MPGHHVERMLGDHTRSHLQHKTADLLADRHIVRFERIQNALARRGVGDELATGQCRAQRTTLRRMLALGLKKERMLAKDIDTALGTKCFVDFGDLGGGCNRVADHTATDMAHDVGDRAVAMDHVGDAGVLCCLGFHNSASMS